MSDFINVKEGISGSIAHEVNTADSIDVYISEQIERIDGLNPHLMKELCSLATVASDKLRPHDPNFDEKFRAYIVTAGIVVYRMLESQADSDSLDNLIGGD